MPVATSPATTAPIIITAFLFSLTFFIILFINSLNLLASSPPPDGGIGGVVGFTRKYI